MPIEIFNWRTHEARVVIKNWGSGTCVEFNPKKQLEDGESLWVIQLGVTQQLQWDPMEWTWKK